MGVLLFYSLNNILVLYRFWLYGVFLFGLGLGFFVWLV